MVLQKGARKDWKKRKATQNGGEASGELTSVWPQFG